MLLPLGQVARIAAKHPLEFLLGQPSAEFTPRSLLGTRDERDPESAVQLPEAIGAIGQIGWLLVHADILDRRSRERHPRPLFSRIEP